MNPLSPYDYYHWTTDRLARDLAYERGRLADMANKPDNHHWQRVRANTEAEIERMERELERRAK